MQTNSAVEQSKSYRYTTVPRAVNSNWRLWPYRVFL